MLVALLITTAAYWAGLSGPFAFDDYNNIVDNKSLQMRGETLADLRQAVLAGNAGPLKRPISMLSFALNRAATGIDPFWFKLTNLAIHLLNGWLVYVLVRRLLALRSNLDEALPAQGAALACAAAACWLVHPAQLTSVLYVVQRMTSLSATFVFAGLIVYLGVRHSMLYERNARLRLWLGVPFLALLGCLVKENGALLFIFALVIEYCLLQFRTLRAVQRRELGIFFLVFVGLPFLAVIFFFVLNPTWLTAPNLSRPFNVIERLMTEARVLFLYLQILLVPSISSLALYYDDFEISRGLLSPITTLASIVGLAVLAGGALIVRRRSPWFAFAVLWFMAAHLIESTVVMLELVHVHRNYIAYLGPIVAVVITVARLLSAESSRLLTPLIVIVVSALAAGTAQRSVQWSRPLEQAAFEVHHRPNSARANYEMGRLFFIAAKNQHNDELRRESRRYFVRAMELDRQSINAPVAILIVDGSSGPAATSDAKDALRTRLSERPIAATEVHFLRSLIDCQKFTDCKQSPQDILDVFGSALAQPHVHKRVKADLLAILGMYYANHLKDLPGCIRMMKAAIALVPNDANHRLNLVHARMASRDLVRAERELNEAVVLDRLGVYSARIRELRTDIAKLRTGKAGS